MEQRHKGFVVGCDPGPNGNIWKVRVKDENSPFDGEKFTVASVHGGLELAKGLNVNFLLGNVDDNQGQKVARAVDVRLETLDAEPQSIGQQVRRTK